MASLVLSGDTSGSITVAAPAVAGSNTQTLAAVTGTLAPVVSGTAQTAPPPIPQYFDFTGIPSWVKRITVMLSGVSTGGSSDYLLRVGSSGVASSGYLGAVTRVNSATPATSNLSSGYLINGSSGTIAAANYDAVIDIFLLSGNTYLIRGVMGAEASLYSAFGCCRIALSGVLDQVRITTVNGTDTFDAGTINIIYE